MIATHASAASAIAKIFLCWRDTVGTCATAVRSASPSRRAGSYIVAVILLLSPARSASELAYRGDPVLLRLLHPPEGSCLAPEN